MHGHADLKDLILQMPVLNRLLNTGLDLVFIAGIGMCDIPLRIIRDRALIKLIFFGSSLLCRKRRRYSSCLLRIREAFRRLCPVKYIGAGFRACLKSKCLHPGFLCLFDVLRAPGKIGPADLADTRKHSGFKLCFHGLCIEVIL